MDESGYYGDDQARLFTLVNLLWRAIRIVLDVGLHTRGMAPAEAVVWGLAQSIMRWLMPLGPGASGCSRASHQCSSWVAAAWSRS